MGMCCIMVSFVLLVVWPLFYHKTGRHVPGGWRTCLSVVVDGIVCGSWLGSSSIA